MSKIELKEYPFRENEKYLLKIVDNKEIDINYIIGTYNANIFVDYKGNDIYNEIIGYIPLKEILE